jgi:hypothetical protein
MSDIEIITLPTSSSEIPIKADSTSDISLFYSLRGNLPCTNNSEKIPN